MPIESVVAGARSLNASSSNPAATPGLPSGVGAGWKLVIVDMIRASNNTAPNAPGTPAGWVSKNSYTNTGTSKAMRITWFYRDWASGLTAPSISLTAASGTAHYALMLGLPGALLGGDPTEYLGANSTPPNSSSLVGPAGGGTTSVPGCACLVAGVRENDVTDGSSITAPTHSGLTFTLHDSVGAASGDDYVFAVASALVPNPMTIGNLSFGITHDTNLASIAQQWALTPVPSGSLPPRRPIDRLRPHLVR